jgi:hypothetical protein
MHPRGLTPVESKLYIVLAKYLLLPDVWWAHPDLNQGPSGYEPVALTAELWARACQARGATLQGPAQVPASPPQLYILYHVLVEMK